MNAQDRANKDLKPSSHDGKKHLPLLEPEEIISSLGSDGRRRKPQPADVKGRFHSARRILFSVLLLVLAALPFIRVGGQPVLLLNVPARQFTVLTKSFGPEDAFLAFFLLTGGAFLLALVTSLWGRVFCGFTCPQTVFLDGIYRPIERLFEGPREQRIRRDKAPLGPSGIARKTGKHLAFLLVSTWLAHSLVFLFVPMERAWTMFAAGPAAEPAIFGWALVLTLIGYFNFGYFREQFCLVVCPYGRLQGALVDDDTLVIAYDTTRGEPRGKAGSTKGDCVDCKRCVVVCPTGIDIRNGLQLDCVGCTACIDACDEVMDKLSRPKGLIRFESDRVLRGGVRKFWRPRLLIYGVLGTLGAVAATLAFSSSRDFEAHVLRQKGAPYVLEGDDVRNTFVLHLINKQAEPRDLSVCLDNPAEGMTTTLPLSLSLAAREGREMIVVFKGPIPREGHSGLQLSVYESLDCQGKPSQQLKAEFIGPRQ